MVRLCLLARVLVAEVDPEAFDLVDWLGPAGAAVFGAMSVWAKLNGQLSAAKAEAATARAEARAAKEAGERAEERVRTLEEQIERFRLGVKLLLLGLRSDGSPQLEILRDVSDTFAVPIRRDH